MVALEKIDIIDKDWILRLMNQLFVRNNSFNPKLIEPKENEKYWKRKLKQKNFNAWAILIPVGLIRIDKGEISVAVDKNFRNQGIAFDALNKLKLKGCIAEIKPENKISIRLFKKLGFVEQKRVFKKEKKAGAG